jgi:hypothetical protein
VDVGGVAKRLKRVEEKVIQGVDECKMVEDDAVTTPYLSSLSLGETRYSTCEWQVCFNFQ